MAVGSVIELAFKVAAGELKVTQKQILTYFMYHLARPSLLSVCFSNRMALQSYVRLVTMQRNLLQCKYCHLFIFSKDLHVLLVLHI